MVFGHQIMQNHLPEFQMFFCFNPLSAEVENYSVPVSRKDHDIATTQPCLPENLKSMGVLWDSRI